MADYRNYKKVLKVHNWGYYQNALELECGHEVFRYAKVPPKSVKCEWCERAEQGRAPDAAVASANPK
jgi:hypothetical protein